MYKKIFHLLFFVILFASSAKAQLEKTIHQTFEVKDLATISINLISDSTLIIPWAGNTILTETKVELYDASPSILAHFMDKEQRYVIQADTSGNGIQLYNVNQERKPIRTQQGECFEQVRIRVFVPEDFKQENSSTLVRIN